MRQKDPIKISEKAVTNKKAVIFIIINYVKEILLKGTWKFRLRWGESEWHVEIIERLKMACEWKLTL